MYCEALTQKKWDHESNCTAMKLRIVPIDELEKCENKHNCFLNFIL